tara:strand:+ start:2167 stop:3015 length:849 start_codon:yes stop_codon:yes gene_type:complete
MNWLTNFVRPKIRALVGKKDVPENLWQSCPNCEKMIHHKELVENLYICNLCNYHFRLDPTTRLNLLFGREKYNIFEITNSFDDPLKFVDKKKYINRLKEYRKKTSNNDALSLASGILNNKKVVVGVLNFNFMGGSMGNAVGESFVKGVQFSLKEKAPFIIFTASGGARMQEGIISLMQMPRTVAATEILKKNAIPYIVVLTNPTTGGVTASFAMLGDLTIAESGSIIGFAGKRVIQDTIREKLPDDFQTAEYLKTHGMVDIVINRKELKSTLESILQHLQNK